MEIDCKFQNTDNALLPSDQQCETFEDLGRFRENAFFFFFL